VVGSVVIQGNQHGNTWDTAAKAIFSSQIAGFREIIEEIARTWQEINEMSPEQVELMLKQNL
jgi:hypothetical protein